MEHVGTSPLHRLDRRPLREAALRRSVTSGAGPWREIRVVEETGSTNADVVVAASAGAPEGLVVVAERQSAGRGRLGRSWQAPARSALTFSVLLRPAGVPPAAYGWLPLIAGMAVADATNLVAEVDAGLKWPNDVLIGERKVAGILAEVVNTAVVVGIGVNVSQGPDELAVPTATSLLMEGAATVDREPLLREILRQLAGRYVSWRQSGGDAEAVGIRDAYCARCVTLGRKVRIMLPADESFEGEAWTIDRRGQLAVRTAEGERIVGAADVVHVR